MSIGCSAYVTGRAIDWGWAWDDGLGGQRASELFQGLP